MERVDDLNAAVILTSIPFLGQDFVTVSGSRGFDDRSVPVGYLPPCFRGKRRLHHRRGHSLDGKTEPL